MVALKVARVGGVGATTGTPSLQLARIGGTGTVFAVPSLKLARIGGTGTAAVILDPIPNETANPESIVELEAVVTAGGAVDSYNWYQISGPTVSLTPNDSITTFVAPSTMNGTTIVIGVTATVDTVTSAEYTATVAVRPQTRWTLNASRVLVGATHTDITPG